MTTEKLLSFMEIETILDLYTNALWGMKKISKELKIGKDRIKRLLNDRKIPLHSSKTNSYPCCSLYYSDKSQNNKSKVKDFRIKGLYKKPEYQNWWCMKRRCYDSNHEKYSSYGAKGIIMYQPWKDNFYAFYIYLNSTIGLRPTPKHTIDRIDSYGHYVPGNIQWLTNQLQAQKRRRNIFTPDLIRYIREQRDTTNKTIRDVATELNINWQNVYGVWNDKTWTNIH